MGVYNFDMAFHLLDAAAYLKSNSSRPDSAKCQCVIYLSLESIEVSLKALLEEAGYPAADLKRLGHDLGQLFDLLCFCRVQDSDGRWRAPTSIRGETVVSCSLGTEETSTVGELMERLGRETAKYPNEIRYAQEFTHFPADVVYSMARKIHEHCKSNMTEIELRLTIAEINSKVFREKS